MFLLYFILWVALNAQITLEICLFGVVIAAAIFAFTCKFMDYSIAREKKLWRNIGHLFRYVYTLVIEIVKANFVVLRMILSEREEIQPALVTFEEDLESPVSKALLANAITLTPGTITVTLEEKEFMVHCLDESLAEGIDELVFAKQLQEMEKGKEGVDNG